MSIYIAREYEFLEMLMIDVHVFSPRVDVYVYEIAWKTAVKARVLGHAESCLRFQGENQSSSKVVVRGKCEYCCPTRGASTRLCCL